MNSQKSKLGSSTISGDWIDKFLQATDELSSPHIFKKWAGILAIAGALERKVWVKTMGSPLYPNLYVVLVAPPGVGKTELTWRVRDLWDGLDGHYVANSSVTKASLIDNLVEANRRVIQPQQDPPVFQFNSLLVSSNELGVLIPAYENSFMNTLTDLYDGKSYSESRRTKDLRIKIDRPNLNILAACTPAYLRETLPPGAWDQGFLSRVLLIYSGEQQLTSLFAEQTLDMEMSDELKEHLCSIGERVGQIKFTREAARYIDSWHLGGQAPRPDHPRLQHYNTRRTSHLLKLSMVMCMSASAKAVIEKEHIQRALDFMIEAEFYMADIFKAMTSGGDSKIIEDTYHHLYSLYMAGGKTPIGQHRLVAFLQERTPAHNIVRILEVMEKSKMIEPILQKGVGQAYRPVRRPPE